MPAKIASRKLSDTYFELVKAFPLTHIRDAAHLRQAHAMIDRLLRQILDPGAQAYLDVLTDLVEIHEASLAPIPDASEADVLRELMAANRLSQQALSKQVGIAQSTISAVLNGNRSLTKAQIGSLAKRFGVSPAIFLPSGSA